MDSDWIREVHQNTAVVPEGAPGARKDAIAEEPRQKDVHPMEDNLCLEKLAWPSGVLEKVLIRTVSKVSDDPGPPPDGGLKAWTQALMGHLVVFNTWGYINSFGVFQTYYVTAFKQSPSAISWIGPVQIFLLFMIGAFSGRATDAGQFRITFIAGSVLQLVGIFMTSLCTDYWQLFLTQGLCTGIGGGLLFTPALALISTYFAKHRAVALTAAATGNATGGMIFPAIVERLLPRIGFPWTMRALGFLMLGITALNIAFLKTRLPPRKSGPLLELAAFREIPYSLFSVGMFLVLWGQYYGYFYIGSFGRDILKLNQVNSINLIIIMNGVGFFGRLIPGYISDRFCGPFNYVIPSALVTGIILYCWAAVDTHKAMLAWAVLYGWFTAGMQGLFPAMIAGLTTNLKKAGVRMGMIFSVTSIAILTGPPLAGALIQRDDGHYLGAQMWAGTVILADAFVLAGARISKTGFKLKVRM